MRPDAGKGLWCCFLLPSAFIAAYLGGDLPGIHSLSTSLCLTSSIYVLCKEKFCENRLWKLLESYSTILLLASFLYIIISRLSFYILLCFTSFCIFSKIYNILLSKCPGSFTCGEATLVTQLAVVMSAIFFSSLLLNNTNESLSPKLIEALNYFKSFQIIIQTCLSAVLVLYMFPKFRTTYAFYPTCIVLGLLWLELWSKYIGENAFQWMFTQAFKYQKRVVLLWTWCVLTCISLLIVLYQQSKNSTSVSTVTRKWFHVLIAAIYIPGMIYDIEFLYVASAVAVFIFMFLETARVLKIWPIGDAIDDAFQIFVDEKDSGSLILTNIYLLVGCSCPMWIYPPILRGFHISYLSGIISVAFGDTAASAYGSMYGKHHWENSKKTVEGTIAAMVVQLIVLMIILVYSDLVSTTNIVLVIISAVTTSLLEAKTTQVDNLVLPIFMYVILSFVA